MGSKTYSLFRSALVDGNANWISNYEKNVKGMTKQFEKIVENLIAEN